MPSDPVMQHNQLARSASPYLRQHADNPVHWQIWNDATLAYARKTDTPILLSIGYSACHWCHVMAHECFEHAEVAKAMNAGFVNIKLDREQRPDIDHVYQLAHQALSGRGGGWPLTVFLDPQDLSPFYIGTYFPRTPKRGLPGFPEVLARVRDYFASHRDELRAQADRLQQWVDGVEGAKAGTTPELAAVTARVLAHISADFDATWGGHRGAPKFPHAAELGWLLRRPDSDARHMARYTLAKMATRGLQDQLGGGFYRYCVDAAWTIPHFEKMLYDNAQLLPLYAQLAINADTDAGPRAIAAAAAHRIAAWLEREMTAPDGGFYSALDADSEHVEGKFYLWSREEFTAALDASDLALAKAAYGLDAPPNFEGRAWHLLRETPLDALATQPGAEPATIAPRLDAIRQRLLLARNQRVRPGCDDKILTAWNAVTISGLARASRLLEDAKLASMAEIALTALRKSVWIDGQLYANIAAPDARIPGFLDDYALLLDALLEMLQVRFDAGDLTWAMALANGLLAHFEDTNAGGFWFAATVHATPLARGRNLSDDALPNGYAMATLSLLRLGDLLGEARYLAAAERALGAAANALAQYPEACPNLLRALAEYDHPRLHIVVRCTPAQQAAWRAALRDGLRAVGSVPGSDAADVFVIPAEDISLPGVLSQRTPRGEAGTAYVCEGITCQAPVVSPVELPGILTRL